MKISILQQDLLSKLQAVTRSTGVRSTLPVLANVLLQADQGFLKLSATNLEIGVIKRVKAQVLEEGETTIPAKTFLEVVSSLSGANIELESNSDQLKISTKNFSATINGISAAEFPAIPLASEQTITIDGSVLLQAVPQIAFAAAVDDGRPVLTGILTEIKKNNIELVATDGFRLAHKTAKLNGAIDTPFRSLIPRKTFEEVVRLLGEEAESDGQAIEIATSENQNQMIFKIGHTEVSSRLIEGQFPAWERIVPTASVNKTTIDRVEFLRAVKLASVFAKDAANVIRIETGDRKIRLVSETKELGNQQTEIEAEVEGEGIVIAFNSRFLTDSLSAFSASRVTVDFSGSVSPAIIRPVGEEGLEHVVMPIRLS